MPPLAAKLPAAPLMPAMTQPGIRRPRLHAPAPRLAPGAALLLALLLSLPFALLALLDLLF